MKIIATVAIQHPDEHHLYLYGRRKDSGRWCIPGGHCDKDETPLEGAVREALEEVGIHLDPDDVAHVDKCEINPDTPRHCEVHLFKAVAPSNAVLDISNDPDSEFFELKYLDPTQLKDTERQVAVDRDLLLKHLNQQMSKSELAKGTRSPSKYTGYKQLEQIKRDHNLGAKGKEYDAGELDQAIVDRKVADAERMVREADKAQRVQKDELEKARPDWNAFRQQVPHVYHATYESKLPSIMREGLKVGSRPVWDISHKGKLYFSQDPEQARSFAETAQSNPEAAHVANDKVVVLKIPTAALEDKHLGIDENMSAGPSGLTLTHTSSIHPSHLSVVDDGLRKDQPRITLPKVKGLPTRPDQEVHTVPTSFDRKDKLARATRNRLAGVLRNRHINVIRHGLGLTLEEATANAKNEAAFKRMIDKTRKGQLFGSVHATKLNGKDVLPNSSTALVREGQEGRTTEHEGAHLLLHNVEAKFGRKARAKVVDHLLHHFHPEDQANLITYLIKRGYKHSSPNFSEEMVNAARDLLVDPKSREELGHLRLKPDFTRMKTAWKNATNSLREKDEDWLKAPHDDLEKERTKASAMKLKPQDPTKLPQNPAEKLGWKKLAASELQKSVAKLVHFSNTPGLKQLDPNYQGTGARGAENKHGVPEVKSTYFYREGTEYEPHVLGQAKAKYTTTADESKLYDLAKDPAKIIHGLRQASLDRQVNPGQVTRDEILGAIKAAGYHGYHNSASSLPNAIGLFHPTTPESEETIAKEELNKAPLISEQDPDFAEHKLETHAFDPARHKTVKERQVGTFGPNQDKLFHHIYTDKMGNVNHSLHMGNPKLPISVIHGHMHDKSFVAQNTATADEHQGQGLGTKLKELALKHHKVIESDAVTSPAEHATWQKLKALPGVKVTLGDTQHDIARRAGMDPKDEDVELEAADQPHVAVYKKPRKLAASEGRKLSSSLEKAMGLWSKGQNNSFNHPEHGSVGIKEHSKGFDVIHNGKTVASHVTKPGVMKLAGSYMKSLSNKTQKLGKP